MTDKPETAAGYPAYQVRLVRRACLYVATKLGDLMDDVIVVGGLAPSLIIDQESLPEGADAHVGSLDLDVGLSLAILDEKRYRTFAQRLRQAGFEQDHNDVGQPTRQRWRVEAEGEKHAVTLDFLIPPSRRTDKGGRLRNIEKDLAAVLTPGLDLAFKDKKRVTIRGETIRGEKAARDVWVCGAGAFVVLKALAFENRGENKDAYDLFYMIRNFGEGPDAVLERLKPFVGESAALRAIEVLRGNFLDGQQTGPKRVAKFVSNSYEDAVVRAEVVGFVKALVDRWDKWRESLGRHGRRKR